MALSDVVYAACDEVGLNRPTSPITQQTDKSSLQLLALLRKVVTRDIIPARDWSGLITTGTITTVASTASYAMPADFDHFVDDTQFLTTSKVPLIGPLNQQDWAENEFGMVTVGPYFRQQLRGRTVYLQPTPSSVQTINYYYVSSSWIYPAGVTSATRVSDFTADTDTFIFNEPLLIAGLVYAWLRSKRLAFDEEQNDFNAMLAAQGVDDRGSRVLSMDPYDEQQGRQTGFIVPITGFGS